MAGIGLFRYGRYGSSGYQPAAPEAVAPPTALTATRNRELRWRGRLIVRGLFDGEHAFRVEDRGHTCRLHHSERFSGVLVPLFGSSLLDATRQGFEAMNVALKARAEGATGA